VGGKLLFALMALLYAAGVALGLKAPEQLAETVIEEARRLVESIFTGNPLELALRIFLNNARVALLTALLSPLVVAPGLLVLANGFVLGIALTYAAGRLGWAAALAAVLPHGVVEIPALLLAAAASTSLGAAIWRALLGRGKAQWRRELWSFAKAIALSLLLFAAAALIEAIVTPALVSLVRRLPPL
jgi:stage II sporulation protein M